MLKKYTNQEFCYWLQGYFEISMHPVLTEQRIKIIIQTLENITEPLGIYTTWLKTLLQIMALAPYNQNLVDAMQPLIQSELSAIFLHVIDPSYDTPHSSDTLLQIHKGDIPYDK